MRHHALSLCQYVCRCIISSEKLQVALYFRGSADGLPFCPSREPHNILQMTLVRACSWLHNQTHSKLWKKHFLWVIARFDTKKQPPCGLKGTRSQYKRQMNCLCFPLCLFKYWNTKSFHREIMLRGLQSKWDSLHENKFFQILGCVWAHVCVTSAKPAGIGSCKTAVFRSRADEQLESTRRMCGGLIECFLGGGFTSTHAVLQIGLMSHLRSSSV